MKDLAARRTVDWSGGASQGLEHLGEAMSAGNACVIAIGVPTFGDSLHRADLGAIFHGMKGEVNLWDRLLLVNGTQSIVDLDSVSKVIGQLGRFGVHDSEVGGDRRTVFYLVASISRIAQWIR